MSRAWPVDGIEPDGTLAQNARRILAVRMAEYYSYTPIVHVEAAVQPLHDLRIAAKRLRYTLELFHDVFGELGGRNVERVKAIQEELGEVHDHDVRIALIDEELASLGTGGQPHHDGLDPLPGLQGLRNRQVAGRRAHYQAFRALWERLAAKGMRAELAALSATPLPSAPQAVVADPAVA
jgi:CHAD domain-containing protein